MRRRKTGFGLTPEEDKANTATAMRIFENLSREGRSEPLLEDPVAMTTGDTRKITAPADVPKVLMLALRDFPRRPLVPSVSVGGLWSCTSSTLDVGAWFAARIKTHRLVEENDWIGDKAVGDASLFVTASRARQLIADGETNAGNAARAYLDGSVSGMELHREARSASVNLKVVGSEPMGDVGPISVAEVDQTPPLAAGHEAEPSQEADEPWAEAFDFGRLVPVSDREIGGIMQPTVSARDVHTFLEAGRDFTTWARHQIERCSLIEGVDAQRRNLPKSGEVSQRGPAPTDYVLCLPAAKKVAMAASGPRGAAVREYFIECERRLLAGEGPIPGTVPPVPIQAPERPRPAEQRTQGGFVGTGQLSMPDWLIPLTMADFLTFVGFKRPVARKLAAEHGPALVRQMMLDGEGASACRHPVSRRVLFARPVLNAWWDASGLRLLPDPQIEV